MSIHLQTIRTEADLVIVAPEPSRDAILVHIYPTGAEMGTRYHVGAEPLVIGRGDACDVHINENSVSRRHAVLQRGGGGWTVTDLGSTNGTFLNNVHVASAAIKDGDYLRVGNCIYRFLTGNNVEAQYHEEIYRLTIIDGLTGIHNKRYLLEFLERELARSERYLRPLALVLFDIDHFKRVNDELGHLAGDAVLCQLAACVRAGVRRDELFARYGGEEFAVVLPEAAVESAAAFGDRVREAVAAEHFEVAGRPLPVTISVGVADTAGLETPHAEELIARADKALYRAKNEGRNCVRAWDGH